MDFRKSYRGGGGKDTGNYFEVDCGLTHTIPEFTEMFVTDSLKLCGDLVIKGRLTIWAMDDILATAAAAADLFNVDTITSSLTLTSSHEYILVDASLGVVTLTLPPASTRIGRAYEIVCKDSTNVVTIDADASETISGDLTIGLVQYEAISIVSDGSNWFVF